MKTKLFMLLFALLLVANLWAQYVTSGTCGENLTWTYNDGVLTISGTGAMNDYVYPTKGPWCDIYGTSIHEVILPNGLTTIGSYAFEGCSGITSINIPSSITSIGEGAFKGCKGLTSIFIPNSVTNISSTYTTPNPFSSCSNLSVINVESGNPTYDSRNNCNAIIETNTNKLISGCKNTIIPHGVIKIGGWSFYGCSDLTSMVIPNSVTSIGENAFSRSGITSITIPHSVTSIAKYGSPFSNCENLTSIIWNVINFPDISSNRYAPFYDIRTNITSFVLGDSVQTFPNALFSGMSGLSFLSIGANVSNVSNDMFSDCTSLTSVAWDVKNHSDFSSKFQSPFRASHANITSFTFGDSVQHIPAYLCCEMNNLDSITIPNSVTNIGESAFEDCTGITNVSIGNGVTNIGEAAFKGCAGLTNVSIGNGVTKIGESSFVNCVSLTSITIPNSVNEIENLAFAGCSGLTAVNFADSIPPIIASTSCFLNTTCNFFIPNENLFAIETAFNDSVYNNYTIEGSRFFLLNAKKYGTCGPNLSWSLSKKGVLIVIGTGQMNNYTQDRLIGTTYRSSAPWWGDGVESVILDERATSVGNYAFYECYLTSINFPNNINSIGAMAFYGCNSLRSVTIGSGVTSIGGGAFTKCNSLALFYCKGTVPPQAPQLIFYNAFHGGGRTPSIFVPCGSLKAYKIAWSYYADSIQYEPSNANGVPFVEGTGRVEVQCEGSITAFPEFGYHFVQWEDGNSDNPRSIDIMEEVTYTAIFEINVYKVDFVDWDNTILDSQQVNHGESAIAPEAPTREGWEFVGWDKNFSSVEDNITIHAQYEAISGIENMPEHIFRVRKIYENGHLYIHLPDGTRYDFIGKRVE